MVFQPSLRLGKRPGATDRIPAQCSRGRQRHPVRVLPPKRDQGSGRHGARRGAVPILPQGHRGNHGHRPGRDIQGRENLELSLKGRKGVFATLFARLRKADRDEIDATLERVNLKDHASRGAGLLSHGQKQWLEIGMLMMQDPKLLLLDEPVAGMSDEETARTGELIHSIAKDRSVLVVEHDMEFVRSLNSRVTVLHEGQVLCEGPMEEVQKNPRVIEVYLGRDSAKSDA